LKNGSPLRIDNSVQPLNDQSPTPQNDEARAMNFTDLFIKRRYSAVVISLLILVLVCGRSQLAVTSIPTENAWLHQHRTTARTRRPWRASSTQPLESAIAQAQGIDYCPPRAPPDVDDHGDLALN